MGMITRMRSKLQSFHTLTSKVDPREQDERIAQTVCLLSVVLLLPYFSRIHTSLLVSSVGLAYSCLVLPMVISANYKYPISCLKNAVTYIKVRYTYLVEPSRRILARLYRPLDRCEKAYLKMTNISTLLNQVIFFMLCDRILLPQQKLTSLYSLMFYNVISYCVTYIKELVKKEDWSPYVNISKTSNMKHLAMSATKIVLEWTKAVTFVITIVFMLLVLGLEQGLNNYNPSWSYLVVTWLYYMSTEKIFCENFPALLTFFQFEILESLESLWAPVILRSYALIMSFLLTLPLLLYGQFRLFIIALYTNVYLRYKEMVMNSLRVLKAERAVLEQYRFATRDELEERDDVCAVCFKPYESSKSHTLPPLISWRLSSIVS